MKHQLRRLIHLLVYFPVVLTVAGCGQDWAIVYRAQPKSPLKVVSDDCWTRQEAIAEAKRLEASGYALKGATCLLTKEAALTIVKGGAE